MIIITGTPGTGKTVVAENLSKLLGIPFYGVSNFTSKKIIDLRSLRMKILNFMRGNGRFILEGHLFCEIKLPAEKVVVLRTHPEILRERLEKRGYDEDKLRRNILCEALDYCLLRAEQKYGEVLQVDTSFRTPDEVARRIIRGKGDSVDWSVWLEEAIYSGRFT